MKWQRILNIFLKITVLLLVIHALVYPDLAQYQNKGMEYRLIGYPLAVFAVVLYRYLFKKSKSTPYSYDTDILISVIIVLDMLGNALGFYGSIEWWDDVMHPVNCALLTVLIMRLTNKRIKDPLIQRIAVVGIVTWLQVAWEIAEYATFVTTNTCEFPTAYRDTIGDLLLGQVGVLLTVQIIYILGKKYSKKKR